MKIKSNEKELRGGFIKKGGNVESDDINKRIKKLVNDHLIFIKADESGWNKLFKDPDDNRYWEMIYSESEMHGGGPLLLRNITNEEAKGKYNLQ